MFFDQAPGIVLGAVLAVGTSLLVEWWKWRKSRRDQAMHCLLLLDADLYLVIEWAMTYGELVPTGTTRYEASTRSLDFLDVVGRRSERVTDSISTLSNVQIATNIMGFYLALSWHLLHAREGVSAAVQLQGEERRRAVELATLEISGVAVLSSELAIGINAKYPTFGVETGTIERARDAVKHANAATVKAALLE